MTTPLGESFPEEFRKKFCQDHLIPGAVLRIHSSHTTPPKIKRCVVLAIRDESISIALTYIIPKSLPAHIFNHGNGRLPWKEGNTSTMIPIWTALSFMRRI